MKVIAEPAKVTYVAECNVCHHILQTTIAELNIDINNDGSPIYTSINACPNCSYNKNIPFIEVSESLLSSIIKNRMIPWN